MWSSFLQGECHRTSNDVCSSIINEISIGEHLLGPKRSKPIPQNASDSRSRPCYYRHRHHLVLQSILETWWDGTRRSVIRRMWRRFTRRIMYSITSISRRVDSDTSIRTGDQVLPHSRHVRRFISSRLFVFPDRSILDLRFGIKLPAGIFIPTLACGALVGRIAALLVEFWHSRSPELAIFDGCLVDAPFGQACVIPGIWAMIGASAFLAGVTRTTISLAVIILCVL